MTEGILKFSNASGTTARTTYNNFVTNYGDFGALQRIGFATATAGGSFDFQNIPSTYQDLMIVLSVRNNGTTDQSFGTKFSWIQMYYNNANTATSISYLRGDSSGNTSTRYVTGDTGGQVFFGYIPNGNATAGVFASSVIHIPNYAGTNTWKTALGRVVYDISGEGATSLNVATTQLTNAINRITIFSGGSGFAAGSTGALYGIKASAA